MRVHIASSARSNKWKPFDANWESFVEERLQIPVITGETFETYKSLDKDEKQTYKDCGGYLFGNLQKDSRAKANVVSRNALLLDMDFAPLNVWEHIVSTYPFEIVMHSTHSHCSATPRYRLIVPLDRDCTPDEYECTARTFAYYLGMELFDKTTFQRNRLMYFPSRSQDGEWVFEWQRGTFLSVDSVLAIYEDWRDMTTWPYHPDEKVSEGNGQKRQHPHEASGIVGAFNREYDIHRTVSEFLSDVYVRSSISKDRYTYLKGSSANGVVVYDDVWSYSYHATDPAEGKLLHSFELLSIHMFEGDAKKAIAFIATLADVRKASIINDFVTLSDTSEEELSEEWFGLLEVDKAGKVVPSDRNVRLIFENDINLKGVFKYNLFSNNVYLTRATTWRKDIPPEGDTIRNVDYPCLRTYLGQKYGIVNRSLIEETMVTIAYEHKYHPIRDYLSGLVWDGVPRIDTALIDYFGVEDNVYTREVFTKTLIGAILRAFKAGVKHDTVLVLVGLEGTAKSEFFKRLGMSWYSDTFDMSRGKEVFEQLQGKWIIEIAEFDKLSRIEVGQVKYFITKSADSYRPAFGHVVEDFPRQCLFVASTNEDTPLKSETGNRRFYPAKVTNGMFERGLWKSKKYVYHHMDKYEVDQMWAEAFQRALAGETNTLSRDAVRIVDSSMEDFEEQSVLAGEIDSKLTTLVPADYEDMSIEDVTKWWSHPELRSPGVERIKYVTGVQLWVEILGRTRESYNKLQSLEMLSAIRKSKVIDANDTYRAYTKRYGRQRCYRIKDIDYGDS